MKIFRASKPYVGVSGNNSSFGNSYMSIKCNPENGRSEDSGTLSVHICSKLNESYYLSSIYSIELGMKCGTSNLHFHVRTGYLPQ